MSATRPSKASEDRRDPHRGPAPTGGPARTKRAEFVGFSFQGHQVSGQVVHLFIGIRSEQVAMTLHRVPNLYCWNVSPAREAADGIVRQPDGHEEIVDPKQPSFHR